MNPWRPVLQRARRALIGAGGALLLAAGIILGAAHLRDRMRLDAGQEQARLGALQGTLAERQDDLDNIKAHIDDFQNLARQGLVGEANRTGWVERLQASRERLRLPETLAYTLKPPRPLGAAPEDPSLAATGVPAVEPAPGGEAPLTHDLEFTLREIHEEELLALLADYRRTAGGRFRVQSCRLGDPGQAGLTATCTLRFFTLPTPPPGASAAGA